MPRKRPVEYSILYTATLCLLAGGAVMVYSASSAESLHSGPGDPYNNLKRYVLFGAAGLVLLHLTSRHGLRLIRGLTPTLLVSSFVLTTAVMLARATAIQSRNLSVCTECTPAKRRAGRVKFGDKVIEL